MSSAPIGHIATPRRPSAPTRNPWWYAVVLVCLYLGIVQAVAQPASNLRLHTLPTGQDSLVLDSMSIVPGSLHLFANGLPVAPLTYALDPYHAVLYWQQAPVADSVFVRYRVLPVAFGRIRTGLPPLLVNEPTHSGTNHRHRTLICSAHWG